MLEKAANGMQIPDMAIKFPRPGLPNTVANGSEKAIISSHKIIDKAKLDQKAVEVL